MMETSVRKFFERYESFFNQSLGGDIRFPLGHPFRFEKFFVKNILLRVGGKVRARGHRYGAGKHRGQPGDNHHGIVFRCSLHAGQQAHGADEPVLDAEDELPDASSSFDQLLFLLDRFESHSTSIAV